MTPFWGFVLIIAALAIAGCVIVYRAGAVDKDKAKAALQSAEARTGNALSDWWARLRK